MGNTITSESMKSILEEIVDAIESTNDKSLQYERVKQILEDNGIVFVKD